jgi:hypothetical protein
MADLATLIVIPDFNPRLLNSRFYSQIVAVPNPLRVLSVISSGDYLTVTFNSDITTTSPGLNAANYSISGPTAVTVQSVSQPTSKTIRVNVSIQRTGNVYTLTMPIQGITDAVGGGISNLVNNFTGVGVPAQVQIAKSVDERTLDIVFNVPVMEADAILALNYSIAPSIAVVSAKRLTDFNYRLTTGPQTINQAYTVTASNIRDILGNS